MMGTPDEAVPAVRPMPPHRIGDITPAEFTQTPADMGLQETSPGGTGPIFAKIQERHMRVFYARYFSVSAEQLRVAIGINQSHLTTADQDLAYQHTRTRLRGMWWAMRTKTFGPNSFFDKLTAHAVQAWDFEATVHNIHLEEARLGLAVIGEDEAARAAREARRAALGLAKADHVNRFNTSRLQSVAAAQQELDDSTRVLHDQRTRPEELLFQSKLTMRRRTLAWRVEHDTPWPEFPDYSMIDSLEDFPPPKTLYKDLTADMVVEFWEDLWSLDIGTTMLWEVRNTIDIPATLANAEYVYKTAFTVLCSELWDNCVCIGFENARVTRLLRDAGYDVTADLPSGRQQRSLVYSYLGSFNGIYLPNSEGINATRLSDPGHSSTADVNRKRKYGLDPDAPDDSGLRFTQPRLQR